MSTQVIGKPPSAPRQNHVRSGGRKIEIGDGFIATSYRHTDFAGLMDPLIMVDHFVKTKPAFGTHAHAGLSAVTVIFEDSEGAFHNRDSLGNDVDLAPGDLYWFKAARGALHNEEPRPGARTHALQVFVNLPEAKRHDAPAAFHVAAGDIPRIAGDHVQRAACSGAEQRAPRHVGAGHRADAARYHPTGRGSVLASGCGRSARVDRQHSGNHQDCLGWRIYRPAPGAAIALTGAPDLSVSSELGAHAVLFQAPPLGEGFIQRGPFAMGSEAELDAVEAAYRAGRLGSID